MHLQCSYAYVLSCNCPCAHAFTGECCMHVCGLASVRLRARARACARVSRSPHHLRHPCACLACAARAAVSLAQPASLAPSFSFALLASPTWRSRCRHHLRRSWPESLLPLASPAMLAPLAPLEPLAQLACRGSVVRLRASHSPMVAQARVRARACLRLRACVCACVRCVRAGCPGAIGQAGHGCPGPWPRCRRFRCQR